VNSKYYVIEVDGDGLISPFALAKQLYEGLLGGRLFPYTSAKKAHNEMLRMEILHPEKSFDVFTVERTKF